MKKGFTLLELIIVIIILGVLATSGFTQYTKVIEKGRTVEAKAVLGTIRTAQQAYYLERGFYADSLADLAVEAPIACTSTHYFRYTAIQIGATDLRCTTNGKTPDAASACRFSIFYYLDFCRSCMDRFAGLLLI